MTVDMKNRDEQEATKPSSQSTSPEPNNEVKPKVTGNECSSPTVKCKPATYDGSGSWIDYKFHFDMVALVNNWNDYQKGLYLAVSLRGQAQSRFIS